MLAKCRETLTPEKGRQTQTPASMEQLQVYTAMWILLCMSGVYRYSSAALISTCADDAACQIAGGDANSKCDTANGNGVCVCKSTHKDESGSCITKGLKDECGDVDDCVAVTNAVCTDDKCECGPAYKEATGTCVAKEHGDPCTADTDCNGQSQECSDGSSKVCICISGHSYNGTKCVVGHGDACTADADCTGLNLKCDTSKDPDVCACKDRYSQDGANCIKVPDNSADVTGMAVPVVIFLLSMSLFGKL